LKQRMNFYFAHTMYEFAKLQSTVTE
jgi:hypothetical protein